MRVVVWLLTASSFVALPAFAQDAQSSSLAETLFQDARALTAKGDHEAACAKFEASLQLDTRAVGTLLNLAICKETTKRYATAWGMYREVATKSRGTRPDRFELAQQRERALAPRLSSIALDVASPRPPGLAITIDGIALAEAAWSSALPLDGGVHTIEASAPDHEPWTAKVELAAEGDKRKVPVPALTKAPHPSAPSPLPVPPPEPTPSVEKPEPPPTDRGSPTKAIGITLTGIGVVALGVGAGLGIDVLSRSDAPQKACPDPCVGESAAASESRREYDALQGRALAATILVPAGAAATIAGVWLWLASGGRKQAARTTSVYFSGTHAGVRATF